MREEVKKVRKETYPKLPFPLRMLSVLVLVPCTQRGTDWLSTLLCSRIRNGCEWGHRSLKCFKKDVQVFLFKK